MSRSTRAATRCMRQFVVFAAFSFLMPAFTACYDAYEDIDRTPSDIMAISLGPSYSSAGKVQHGARRIPLAAQSFTILNMDDSSLGGPDRDPSLSSALFNTDCMVCKIAEPEYFMHATIKNPDPPNSSAVNCSKVHTRQDTIPSILKELRAIAETWTQGSIDSAVVAVPTYFSQDDRDAVRQAGETVGLHVLRIVNTSTAAGIAYGIDKSDEFLHVVIIELGRENFEVSVVEVDMGVFDHQATSSDLELGKMIGCLVENQKARGNRHFRADEISLLEQTLVSVERAIREANLSKTDIAHVVVTGEYTRAREFRGIVETYFNGKRLAALNDGSGSRLVPENLDHDEHVTFGAAVLADILAGHERHSDVLGRFSLQPRTLSVETVGGEALRAFQRWTMLPASKTLHLTTTADGQTAVVVSVFQGEVPEARKNDEVVSLRLDCVPPAPRGIPKVTLVLDMYSDDVGNLKLDATAHLVGADEDCRDGATAVLHDFYAVESITSGEFELEAAYVYDRSGSEVPGVCLNRQSRLDQHYITAEEF
ncbi:78 kDa glucose-regulated -like protein [Colletotrichum tanaceti]|uniref:78 kDa glucose-regulated-like protein n=1 Tax=Colletotrichum tanaceti TaxID=1306861 RepID=A0A4U6XG11_9PEZI|nr:78 kDa glucose-regulated -like protein [Colletotrichum tanaceti]KAJ0168236.1 78 kDa glucose-regulated -like protein [Colletotrichum tanaceti]TKW54695.1 78 kDa glucose-regulated -like protein [Colletotrichum tanaceti]